MAMSRGCHWNKTSASSGRFDRGALRRSPVLFVTDGQKIKINSNYKSNADAEVEDTASQVIAGKHRREPGAPDISFSSHSS